MKTMSVTTRWMIRADMPDVLDIEQDAFGMDAWTDEVFREVLRQRNVIGTVAEDGDRIVGYAIYALFKDSVSIMRIVVARNDRRCGYGSQLVRKLKAKLSPKRRERMFVFVPAELLGAQLFFRSQRFIATSILEADEDEGEMYLMDFEI